MLAHRTALAGPVPAAGSARSGQATTPTPLPERETARRRATRWLLGCAYALHPRRIANVPHLLVWTACDVIQGGTLVPKRERTQSRPDTFGGVVRDLSPASYMAALRLGFFPWAHCGPLKWWTRRRRAVLLFPDLHVSRRLKRLLKSARYRVTFDMAFEAVLSACAAPRSYNWHTLTWLTPRYMRLFSELHRQGHAHSFEVWNEAGELVGGGFGIAAGRVFVGESMFSREADTSKLGCAVLFSRLAQQGFAMVDARDMTPVLETMGFREIPRAGFEKLLDAHASVSGVPGSWTTEQDPA